MGLHMEEEEISNLLTLKIFFSESLDIDSVANMWNSCINTVIHKRPAKLVIDLKAVSYCDGAGICLLQTLKNHVEQAGNAASIENSSAEFQQLLDYSERPPVVVPISSPAEQLRPLEKWGKFIFEISQESRKNIIFVGSVLSQLFSILIHPRNLNWQELGRVAERTGPQALPIIMLIGFLIGLISTFQAAPAFGQFGAQIYIIDLVALGLVREMGPLMTAVLLAGRSASAFAAELGSMKISQEIDALTIMGLDPIRFLVLPRILAAVLLTPFLNAFFIAFALLGLFIVMTTLNYPLDAFLNQLIHAVKLKDCVGGAIKSFVFSLVIATTGCLYGLKTKFGAESLGISTTSAVVVALIMLVLVDGAFAAIYYALGV
ncbi:MAG: ABC transporter permease [Oligoflexia bacterium]|nr:ABC transporter permease [Oligoflexia bacterium]MBF0364323.1 ABC transporter permease [Oligoflexia bacterium]